MSEFDIQAFEDSSRQNGVVYWPAHEFMLRLGYETWPSFKGVVNKAISLCARIGVDAVEAAIPYQVTEADGRSFNSYKLTRFGCLLVTMQADTKKPEVAKAQAVMASVANTLIERYLNTHSLERLEKREELKLAESLLGGAAQGAGLKSSEYGIFKDAGVRGMYNMSLTDLKDYKGASTHKGTLYDLMGLTELAANTFRVTQTAERLKNQAVNGLKQANATAHQVGREVREVMIRTGGTKPEDLVLEEDMNELRKGIKSSHREMKKLDKPKIPKAKKQEK